MGGRGRCLLDALCTLRRRRVSRWRIDGLLVLLKKSRVVQDGDGCHALVLLVQRKPDRRCSRGPPRPCRRAGGACPPHRARCSCCSSLLPAAYLAKLLESKFASVSNWLLLFSRLSVLPRNAICRCAMVDDRRRRMLPSATELGVLEAFDTIGTHVEDERAADCNLLEIFCVDWTPPLDRFRSLAGNEEMVADVGQNRPYAEEGRFP